jgi:hypothetical protein
MLSLNRKDSVLRKILVSLIQKPSLTAPVFNENKTMREIIQHYKHGTSDAAQQAADSEGHQLCTHSSADIKYICLNKITVSDLTNTECIF